MTKNNSEDRRLIEDYLPIQAISAEASREKRHISTLHLWWARRPLAASRAAIYGALVPVSRFISDEVNSKAVIEGRREAERFVSALCQNDYSPSAIEVAEMHILEAHAKRLSLKSGETVTVDDIRAERAPRPRVLDMFAGGGAIPLEALRLGCEAYALDLNPVAHIIELCTLVYPQRYGKPDNTVRGMTGSKNEQGETSWGALAEEVRYWGQWTLEQVREEIGDLYPQIPDPKAKPVELVPNTQQGLYGDVSGQGRLKTAGAYLTPVAYLWTRTVVCKNPVCGAIVPLVKQTWLCKKNGRYVAMRMIAMKGEKRTSFEVVEATSVEGLGFDPEAFSVGGNAACPFCKTVADADYVQSEGKAKRIKTQLMAIVCTRQGSTGKIYFSADELEANLLPDEQAIRLRTDALCKRTGLSIPNEPINPLRPSPNARGMSAVTRHGLTTIGDLFAARQMLCLLTFVAVIRDADTKMSELGVESERKKAITTFLGAAFDKVVDYNSSLCSWHYNNQQITHTFGRQALPMVWDFTETNPLVKASGSWSSMVNSTSETIPVCSQSGTNPANVQRGNATSLPWSEDFFDAVITDPPYYDNVPYADISDFFYVWLKRTVGHLYPEHFASELTPKKSEATALSSRHGGDMTKATDEYEAMMFKSFQQASRVLKSNGQLVVVYAHKTTLGWSTLVDALRRAAFTVTEAWALDTEMKARMVAKETAALASSIFLVARKREGSHTGEYETEVRPELERIVRERVETLWGMGITGADLVIAAVGAGLRAFTRFARVEFLNGEEVPATRFLTEVEGVVLETLLEKIFDMPRAGVASVDPPSRFYVLWRYAYGAAELDAGEAIVFAYPQSVELDGARGLTQGKDALVEKKKNKYRLRDFAERGAREDLGLPDGDAPDTRPSLVDVLHRVLWLMENRPALIADYLYQAQPDRERLRLVAQALAGPGLRGGSADAKLIRTTTAEASALGKLLANWRTLVDARLEDFLLR